MEFFHRLSFAHVPRNEERVFITVINVRANRKVALSLLLYCGLSFLGNVRIRSILALRMGSQRDYKENFRRVFLFFTFLLCPHVFGAETHSAFRLFDEIE